MRHGRCRACCSTSTSPTSNRRDFYGAALGLTVGRRFDADFVELLGSDAPYGKLAMFADPFGHGFCLIEFNQEGYDAIAT